LALHGARTSDVVIKGQVLHGKKQSWKAALPCAALGNFLEREEVVVRGISCEIFEILAELVDLNQDGRMLAKGLKGKS
jgi:hypothetical protein